MKSASVAATLKTTITELERSLAPGTSLTSKEIAHVEEATAHLEEALRLLLVREGDQAPRVRRWFRGRVLERGMKG